MRIALIQQHATEDIDTNIQRGLANLDKAAAKLTKDWAFHWIKQPHSFRSDTWMPAFFGQSNNSDPESLKRTDQEILSMVHYLFNNSNEYETNRE